jgi:threonine efflux protein
MFELLPLFLGVFLAQVAPGPNMLAVSSISLSSGRRAGLLAACGVAVGVFLTAIFFAFAMRALLESFPFLLNLMKIVGGGYLLFLGLRSLHYIIKTKDSVTSHASRLKSDGNAFMTGLFVVLTNPKALMMWVAISMYVASLEFGSWGFLLVGGEVAFSALLIYAAYAWLFSTGVAVRSYQRFFKGVEASFGLIFGALGVKLLIEGLASVRAY